MDPATEPSPAGNGRDEHERDESGPPDSRERPLPKPPIGARLRRLRREHPRGLAIAFAVILLLLAVGVAVWLYLRTYESTDDAQIDGHISPISTRVNGTVVAVYIEDNQRIKTGQVLVELDARDYQVALARAEAELAQARAQLAAENPNLPITATATVTEVATTSEEVTTARAAVAAAERDYQSALARTHADEANDARAQADLARYRYLVHERAIPAERFDQIVATAKAAHAEVESSRASARGQLKVVEQQRARVEQALSRQGQVTKNAPRQITIRQANLEARQAAVKAAEAAVARARLDIEYTRIVAPIAGVVGRRSVEPGQRVQPGEQLLALVELADIWITANFKETQLQKLRIGQSARIHVDALDVDLDGWVESFSAASGARYSLLPPENATGNYVKVVQRLPVRIRLKSGQDPGHRLRVGMSVVPKVRLR